MLHLQQGGQILYFHINFTRKMIWEREIWINPQFLGNLIFLCINFSLSLTAMDWSSTEVILPPGADRRPLLVVSLSHGTSLSWVHPAFSCHWWDQDGYLSLALLWWSDSSVNGADIQGCEGVHILALMESSVHSHVLPALSHQWNAMLPNLANTF